MALKTTVQVKYWCDIPVQVKAKKGRSRFSVEMPPRFQMAIKHAAEVADVTSTMDGYLDQYFWTEPKVVEGSPEEIAKAVAAHLDETFAVINWQRTAETIIAERAKSPVGD